MTAPKIPKEKEIQIENGILDYLQLRQVFAWKSKTVGTWDNNKSIFRRKSKRYMVGISDILGIYRGKPLAIEVKGARGYLRPDQKIFLKRFAENGGLAVCARSVQDVVDFLDEMDNQLNYDPKHVSSGFTAGQDLVSGVGSE